MRIPLSDRLNGVATRDTVYLALRDAIVSAELAPGRRLSENELAELLGVSRTPVREALARLRDERLVAIVPQLGTFVTLISPQAVADAAFVREALECSAIRLAAARADDAGLAELQANLAAQQRACEAADAGAFYRLDDGSTACSATLSGHEIAWRLSQPRQRPPRPRPRASACPSAGYLDEMLAEHRAVVAARRRARRRRAPRRRCATTCGWCSRSVPQIQAAAPRLLRGEPERAIAAAPAPRRGGVTPARRELYEQMVLIRVFETEAERQYKAARSAATATSPPARRPRPSAPSTRSRPTTCSSPATAATASRSRAASRPRR